MVTLENLTVSYRHHPALHHISGRFAAGSLTAVIGPNGAGKTTLLKSIAGVLPKDSGKLSVATPSQRIAYLPQLAEFDRGFPIDVHDCVALGSWGTAGAWRGIGKALRARVDQALRTVGLEGFERRRIGTLSAGQLQRVMFARTLVQEADLILLDEPFNAVDAKTTQSLLALVHEWQRQRRTVIAVVHDDALVQAHFPQTLLLAREVVAWGATQQVLSDAHWRHARAMAEAWDESAADCTTDPVVAEPEVAA